MLTRSTFRAAVRARQPLIGTFVKTPSPIVCEVLGLTPLDCVCLDTEHAPFGRTELDGCLMTLAAADKPALVRVASGTPAEILSALDMGATGVVLPHIKTADQARGAVAASHFGPSGRGYAGSTRAARYTHKPIRDHLAESAATTTVVAQVEDAEALDALDAIARVEGLDCLFIGRIDLTISLGADTPQSPVVVDAVKRIVDVGCAAGIAVGMFVPSVEEVEQWLHRGASVFLLGSEHQFLLDGARTLTSAFRRMTPASA